MTDEYKLEISKILEQKHRDTGLYRPMRVDHYDDGDTLQYRMTSICGKEAATVSLAIKKFVGGGFAGQVYKAQVTAMKDGIITSLQVGSCYALKILIPPSRGSLFFRNVLYGIGFQAPFQLQTNPAAARSGAIWQKFIRRAAKIKFGDETAVNDIHATLIDQALGSCGEISDWVEGRTWRLEVDEHLDTLAAWQKGKEIKPDRLGSPEYRAKYTFMHELVALMHELGAHEFARQYEWSTGKSQPNCLKRINTEDNPTAGLVAVDFRAGLTLLPFLPMSPGDFMLIGQGIKRGSLVQFDRGDIRKLETYVENHKTEFSDMRDLLDELKTVDSVYRNSVPDITHNHVRLLFSKNLWSTILNSAVTGWQVQNLIDETWRRKLSNSVLLTLLFMLLGAVPFLGGFFRKIWARPDWRKHYRSIITRPSYSRKAIIGRVTENLIRWYRNGRIDEQRALKISRSPLTYYLHLPFAILPIGIYRSLTDFSFLKAKLDHYLARPVRLYFNASLREEWLRDMIAEGEKKGTISPQDRDIIISQLNEPFIQKYLKSLAVHVCTAPISQVVSVIVAVIYVLMHPELPSSQAWAIGFGIIALFQVTPVSPGSLVRGLYVLFLVIRERNFKDYNIAVFLGFFKYIGYLAFPIQMAYRYPVLARFMAGHWSTSVVHIVPVFGESGAWLERWVFCLFYNWPLTLGRRIRARLEKRKQQKPRSWHILPIALAASSGFLLVDYMLFRSTGEIPGLSETWWAVVLLPLLSGSLITLLAKGASPGKRIKSCLTGSLLTTLLLPLGTYLLPSLPQPNESILITGFWQLFLFSVFSVLGFVITELMIPDPDISNKNRTGTS